MLGDAVRPAHLLQLVADGVAGRAYLLTERIERGEEILDAIRAVASGGSVVDPIVMERLAAAPTSLRCSRASPHASSTCSA